MSSSAQSTKEQPQAEMTHKDRLDQAARETRQPNNGKEASQPSLVEKVTEYVPAAAKILGTGIPEQPEASPAREPSGPPNRPDHDEHIEEFMRDQHRSKTQDGGRM